ncbi:Gfo/Idh/MocA family oxidoreductase, partial [bacterium]|nr:Gfo/Idh/MocA family oxidoreductase [bacterium]
MADRDRVSRRGFLQGAAWGVAAPYMLTSSALAAPASDRVTVGKIGCGGRGGGIGAVGGQIIAACDVWKPRRDRYAKSGAKAYRDFREMLLNDDIDAVAIATPDHWHVPTAIAAAKAGKDMYVEKPPGVSI